MATNPGTTTPADDDEDFDGIDVDVPKQQTDQPDDPNRIEPDEGDVGEEGSNEPSS